MHFVLILLTVVSIKSVFCGMVARAVARISVLEGLKIRWRGQAKLLTQTYRQTDIQTDRQTDRQIDRQTYIQTDRQTDRQIDRKRRIKQSPEDVA